ncbi:MAG TPA: type II toxin-antitoxin system prevent-host-death family antitoxin [Mycobacteriales bacterium]|nr:type II toxin-antitoxin system prevent-host-death family antitoxin [Mycobacteriales bacterium]
MEGLGVRELRQHASRYLARVRRGESFEITDRGTPVALLVPVTGDRWDDLVARGLVQPATGDLLDVEPTEVDASATAVLAQLRADER